VRPARLRPDAIVWDLDGTLVDSAADLAAALNQMLAAYGFAGLPVSKVRRMIGDGISKLLERGFRAAGLPLSPGQFEDLVPSFNTLYTTCATHQTCAYPGIPGVLEQLCELGIPMGVCSNKPEALSRQIIEGLGLSDFFNSVVGGDTTKAKKPDPLPLQTCLRELDARVETSLFIGDSSVDIKAARAAGVPVFIVPWGYTHVAVTELDADFILERLNELPGIVLGQAV